MEGRRAGKTKTRIKVIEGGGVRSRLDSVATEEPLEIRLNGSGFSGRVAVTMRTPGSDYELAAGFLFSEGLITSLDEIAEIGYCVDRDVVGDQQYNVVTVDLRPHHHVDATLVNRQFGMTSACGVCGKESLDQIERRGITPVSPGPSITPELLYSFPEKLRNAQGIFDATGGLHAAGLFTAEGKLLALREDVGRHNAVDKLIGWALLQGKLPLNDQIVMVSGRTSFEIAQKCAAAGVPILCAVSAPSSLAIDLAKRFRMTLIGFLRGDRFNIYAGPERVLIQETFPGTEVPG
jgi:FdhD protein